jgi:signal transduction histidine kinase
MIRRDAVPLRHSLLARLTLALGLFMALLGACLYFAIEHFVSAQFRAAHEAEARGLAARLEQAARDELERFDGMARLLAADTDLTGATWYHLFLEGEREHPQAALRRIAQAFRLPAASLRDGDGRLVASVSEAVPGAEGIFAEGSGRLLWHEGRVWAMARAPLRREGREIAHLVLVQPAEALFPRGLLTRHEASVHFLAAAPAADDIGLLVALPSVGTPVELHLHLPDTVAQALSEVKLLIAGGVAAAGLLLVSIAALVLRWQMAPLAALTGAAAAIEGGRFVRIPQSGGRDEISYLVERFNAMSGALARLREMERRVAHQEQLSAIGRVAARVAHDINNPLTVIANTAKLMRRGAPDGQWRAVDLIVHHCDRCMETVRALLDFGRPLKISPRPLEVRAWLRELVRHWRAGADDTVLELDLPETAVWIEADPLPLERMLANLLDNARQAADGGTVRVGVTVEENALRIEVVDSGPGFAPQAREHLFEPFYTTKAGGTGLGLPSALAVARAHGGDIEIAPGGPGGRVIVRLPLAQAATGAALLR